jgi:Fe-S oxidoreductase
MNMPAARAGLLRDIAETCTAKGPGTGKSSLEQSDLDLLYTYFYQCSLCGRCTVFCPFGVETAEITAAARGCLAEVGMIPEYLAHSILNARKTGNSMGLDASIWKERAAELQSEIREEKGMELEIDVDRKGADVLIVISLHDLTDGETLKGYASVLHCSGRSWTLSSRLDSRNFETFADLRLVGKAGVSLMEVKEELEAAEVVFGESGHGFVAALREAMKSGGLGRGRHDAAYPRHICQLTADLIRKGRLKLDSSANKGCAAALHEPCALARASKVTADARFCLKSAVESFREMPVSSVGEYTYCCGGGGAMMAPELANLRSAGALPRMEALKASGVSYLAAPCETCRSAFAESIPRYRGILNDDVRSGSIHALIYRALKRCPGGDGL